MNAERLIEHYEQIADAPDAIARLRRFILDLAVRGKLVPQNPNDEPASELLKRVVSEKGRLAALGKIRASKATPKLAIAPFQLPSNWCWSHLAEIGVLNPRNEAADELNSSFVPMPLIAAEYGVANQHERRPWGEIKKGYSHFAEGDVGLAKITPCFENGKSTVFRRLTGGIGAGTTELHIVRPFYVDPDYILLFLKSPHFIENGIPRMTGTAGQKRVPTEYFAHTPFPLAPLAEQHRIVAKVGELMALCDRLEEARANREATRDRLVAASLARLNTPDSETFQADARFALDALPALTSRPDQIRELRQTILNLAVRGMLLPQDPSDETLRLPPLKQFAAASGLNDEVFEECRHSLSLPSGWQIAPLAQLSENIVDCPHTTPKWTETGEICVRTNQLRPRALDLSQPRYVSPQAYLERIERLEPKEDDILYSREGGILGIACRVPPRVRLCLGQRLMLIRAGAEIRADFLEIVLNSPFITNIAKARTTGGAAPRVNMSTVRAYPIPVPPLREQHRIVAKVDTLMALCDRLESSLNVAVDTRRRLLEAILAETHAPVEDRAMEAAE
ncbi:restriction endonuclease subunit S [Rhodopseudomonas palustris]|uniref:restriction endonuclease subunit S n=1 Tax=Rhodopseudomonas palustris TaxID=1076 RepID=UPI000CEBBE96|nr:restriction endonuclease subunit S [Rhodopseudomonas palustris]PPQ44130.1 restriction endonuclease subunit S [Rhodopseudomonas palustris]